MRRSCASARCCGGWSRQATRSRPAHSTQPGAIRKQILDEAESRVFRIAEEGARGRQGFIEIQPLLTRVVERIQELFERANPSDVTGVPSGFADLDSKTSGFQPGDLIIVAGSTFDGQDFARAQHR